MSRQGLIGRSIWLAAALALLWSSLGLAQDSGQLTIRTLMVNQGPTGFTRTSGRICDVYTNGVLVDTVIVDNGDFTVSMDRTGETLLRFNATYGADNWFNLTVIFTSPDEFALLYDEPTVLPEYRQIPLLPNSDGSYYFDYRRREVGFFKPQDNLQAPILGRFRDPTGGQPLLPQLWTSHQRLYGNELTYSLIWTYGEPNGQPVSMVVTWTYPDGSNKVRIYPQFSQMETEDGITAVADRGHRDPVYGDYPFFLRRTFSADFIRNLPPGDYRLAYQLLDPDNNLSNPREHLLTVEP